jgi:hypothetical protein
MAVPSSGIVDLAIGLVFVFGVTAALASAVTELISRLLGLRAAYLLSGLRELLDSGSIVTDLGEARKDYDDIRGLVAGGQQPAAAQLAGAQAAAVTGPSATAALLGGPILGSQGMPGKADNRTLKVSPPKKTDSHAPNQSSSGLLGLWRNRRSLPSYISSRSFADALIDLLVPDASGDTTMDKIRTSIDRLPAVLGPLKSSLRALAKNVGDDITKFRTAVEHWYDDHMDRVSGWYKRRVAKITLVVGAILVVLLNINALTIARTLYSDSTVNAAVSSVASNGKSCPAGGDERACLSTLESDLSSAAAAGLPVGWGTVRDCLPKDAHCNWLDQRGVFSRHGGSPWQLILVLLGFLIMVGSIVPGARFWFGLLSKLGSLRTTGPKPASTTS